MKILYVPDHMRSALEAAGAKANDFLSIEKLVNILSPEDVAFYCYVNMNLKQVLPDPIVDSFDNLFSQAENFIYDLEKGPNASKRSQEAMRVLQEYCLNDSAPKPKISNKRITCDLMDENTIRFSHVEEDEAFESSPQTLRALYDRVIQQQYAFQSFDRLAKLPLFAGYLEASRETQGLAA